jgi:protein-tyrosine phosphatase
LCRANGIEFVAFPIADRGVPLSAREVARVVREIEQKLVEGKGVAVHCRQGVGRSAMLAACLLASSGMDVRAAFQRIAAARGCPVPDTEEQRAWVEGFARQQLTRAREK